MTQDELNLARTPEAVEALLTRVEPLLQTDSQKTAYNFLVDYLDCPDWFARTEGGGSYFFLLRYSMISQR